MLDSFILYCYENGYSDVLYNGIQFLALFIQALSLILYRKAYGFSLKRSLAIYCITYPFYFFCIYLITWIEYGFTNWGANNIVRLYMWAPLLLYPFSKLLKVPYGKFCDYFAPSASLSFAIGHIGCIFAGCCCGYPSSFGIYNPVHHERLFPIQFVECAVCFAIWLFLLWYARWRNYEGKGKVLALFLILYGSSRFVCEFFRNDTKLFLGISELAIWAFLAFVVGLLMMLLIYRHEKKAAL